MYKDLFTLVKMSDIIGRKLARIPNSIYLVGKKVD